jgi:transcriptional regulator with XRE-family HTH domain
LRQCRLFAGLTQKALAERTGIPEDKISSLESGRSRGYLDEIRAIVTFTGCGDQEKDILQCWRDFAKPPKKPKPWHEAIDYSEQT